MPELTKDALELLQRTAQQAAAPIPLKIPARQMAYFAINGKIDQFPIDPPPRAHFANTLADLAVYAEAAQFRRAADNETNVVIWFDPAGAVAVLNDQADRADTIRFQLETSREYATLALLDKHRPYHNQREFLRLLKMDLGVPGAALAQFRKLDWKTGTTGQATIERGRESLGKAIEAHVTAGGADLPETITVEIPIYKNPGETQPYAVPCLLDFDATNAQIQLVPASNALDRIVAGHMATIFRRLNDALGEDNTIPVYFGRP